MAAASAWRGRRLYLVADDLTGTLDAAAQFCAAVGPLAVTWRPPVGETASVAVDTGNRERGAVAAAAAMERHLPVLAARKDAVSFLKLDSLLRGHAGTEIAACAKAWPLRSIVVAPAMPFQGRVTRLGRQVLTRGADATPIGEDIASTLAAAGIPVSLRRPGEATPPGVSLWDCESDDDLRTIVAATEKVDEPPLWCGSAGLAGALATQWGDGGRDAAPAFHRPLLGLFGSDHAVMRRQIEEVAEHVIAVADAKARTSRAVMTRFHAAQVVLLTFRLPADIDREGARRQIDAVTRSLLVRFARPATFVASGGETLRTACEALEADHLEVDGQIEPGIPCSWIRGGLWDGVRVISKSGAFGRPDFLSQLVGAARPQQKVVP